VLVSAEVRAELKRFTEAKLWTGQGEKHADENNEARRKYGSGALPLLVIADADGRMITRLPPEGRANFVISEAQLLEALRSVK
jgi:hypothetical protein